MTDREALIAMLDRAGIVWRETEPAGIRPNETPEGWTAISVSEEDGGPANSGYGCFVSIFTFDDAGALKILGAWE